MGTPGRVVEPIRNEMTSWKGELPLMESVGAEADADMAITAFCRSGGQMRLIKTMSVGESYHSELHRLSDRS